MFDGSFDPLPFHDDRSQVACPACGYRPPSGTQWVCAPDGCGLMFDTFATHGRCPHCDARFAWTMCPVCAASSSHRAWYAHAG